ncbi:histidine kinase [Haloechinothrix sp. LS1_15]|uniref:sensor histidine kinase n=1 Tax=Haloechinothrix sp. LS1_15 TaxID=2652248 RepID=UPI0029449659|nr:histidine kinase [Haloechinothrix sp. LS1_15]MDV6011670.1 histidine kinase [Haloechinothrix sp. LS1_15]
MTRRDLVIDTALALVACGLTLAILFGGGLGTPSPGARAADATSVGLVLLATLPLVLRRRFPLAAYGVMTAATLLLFGLNYPVDVPIGPLLGVYALAVNHGGAPPVRRLAAAAAAAGFVPATAVAYLATGADVRAILVPELLWIALLFAGAWIAGDRAQLRRAHITELEERARRAENDVERERRIAVAEERTRIARELHDSAGHALNVVLMQAGAARLLQERDPEGSRGAISTIEQVARATIGEIDRLVRVLRTGEAADPPRAGPGEIEDLVERHRASGLRITADVRGSRTSLPDSLAWATYRLLQEALTNAARHGDGSAEVTLRFADDAVELTVTNPYRADDVVPGSGHGIVGMRERVSLLAGTLDVDGDHGTFRVHARLPRTEAVAR